jgi:hypothetical protein
VEINRQKVRKKRKEGFYTADRQTARGDRKMKCMIYRQAGRHTSRQRGRQADRQTYR